MRQEWRIATGLADVLIIRAADQRAAEVGRAWPGTLAAGRLPRLLLAGVVESAQGRGRILEMLRIDGPGLLSPGRIEYRWLLSALEEAFRERRLLALPVPRPVFMGIAAEDSSAPPPEPVPPSPIPEEKTTWIEIELLDPAGEPVPHEPWEMVLADGTTRKGILGANGVARLDGIIPGSCKVTFPGFDGREWRLQ